MKMMIKMTEIKGLVESKFSNKQLENVILSHLILKPDKYQNDTMKDIDFFYGDTQSIYRAYRNATDSGASGYLSVKKYLQKDLHTILSDLKAMKPNLSINDFDTIVNEVRDLAEKRKLQATFEEGLSLLNYKSSSDVADFAFDNTISRGTSKLKLIKLNTAIDTAINVIKQRKDGIIIGVKCRWPKINSKIGGSWQKGTQYIIGARPSTGKTAFANMLIDDFTDKTMNPEQDILILYWNFEMPSWKTILRLVSSKVDMSVNEILSAEEKIDDLTFLKLENEGKKLKGRPVYFIDIPASPKEIREEVMRFYKSFPDSHIINILDHTLLTGEEDGIDSNMKLVSKLSKTFMDLKKRTNCTNIILSQVKRESDSSDRRSEYNIPRISDLVWSSEMEQDADVIMFLHDIHKHGFTEFEGHNVEDDMLLLSISKNRDGENGIIMMQKDLAHNKFLEYDNNNIMNEDGTINL